MNEVIVAAVVSLVSLTGPKGKHVDIAVNRIISLHEPNTDPQTGLFHSSVKCVVHTVDGKFISVVEDCKSIRRKMENFNGNNGGMNGTAGRPN